MVDGTLAQMMLTSGWPRAFSISSRVADYEQRWADLQALPWLQVTKAVMARALTTQRLLAARGQHRRPIPDLVIAAAAAEYDATVLHYGGDFDLIAAVTDQPTRWIIPSGTGHGQS